MSNTVTTSMRLDKATKDKAYKVFKQLGLNPSQAMNLFLRQVAYQNGLPFEVKIPNQTTIDAMNEDLSTAKAYSDVDALFDDLKK